MVQTSNHTMKSSIILLLFGSFISSVSFLFFASPSNSMIFLLNKKTRKFFTKALSDWSNCEHRNYECPWSKLEKKREEGRKEETSCKLLYRIYQKHFFLGTKVVKNLDFLKRVEWLWSYIDTQSWSIWNHFAACRLQ